MVARKKYNQHCSLKMDRGGVRIEWPGEGECSAVPGDHNNATCSRRPGHQMSRKTLMVLLITALLELTWGRTLSDSKHIATPLGCTDLYCQHTPVRLSEKAREKQLRELLVSRLASIYHPAVSGRKTRAGELGKETPDFDLLREKFLGSDVNLKKRYELWGADGFVDGKQLNQIYAQLQSLKPVQWETSDTNHFTDKLKHVRVDDTSRGFIPQGADNVKPKQTKHKRQQGWHTQYGKRASALVEETQNEAQTSEPDLSSHVTSLPGTAANYHISEDYEPQERQGFLAVSKTLSEAQRDRLAEKLAALLRRMDQEDRRQEEEETRDRNAANRPTPRADTTSHGGDSLLSAAGDIYYRGFPFLKLNADGESSTSDTAVAAADTSDRGRSYKSQDHFRPGGVDTRVDQAQKSKRQQGWHTRYGKRGAKGRMFFLHD